MTWVKLLEIELFDHFTMCKQITDIWLNTSQYLEQFNCVLTNEVLNKIICVD